MISVPWNTVAGDSACINDVFPCTSAGVLDWTKSRATQILAPVTATSPQIQIQIVSSDPKKDGTYETYYYVSNAKVAEGPDKTHPVTEPGWCNANGYKADPKLLANLNGVVTPGVSIWFKDPEHEVPSVTENGEVPTKKVTVDCAGAGEFRLRAPAFPKATCINDLVFEGLDGSGVLDWTKSRATQILAPVTGTAPQIQIQIISDDPKKDGTYETYYYVSNAKVAEGPDKSHPVTEMGWCNANGYKADPAIVANLNGTIPVTGAFWVKSGPTGEAFTITFNP